MKFKRTEDPVKKALDTELLNLFAHLNDKEEFDDESEKVVAAVAKLYELRQKDKISMDAMVAAATHVAGLVLVLQHEKVHVIASKAFGLIKKIV